MNEISAIENQYELYFNSEDIDIVDVSKQLTEHMRNKLYFTTELFRSYKQRIISEDFQTKNLRETVFIECTFENANLCKTGLSGSMFDRTTFLSCNYTDTNFQSSDFRKCTFKNANLHNTHFNRSIFINTNFYNCTFDSVSMCDCRFVNCIFDNCQWNIRLENTIFKDSTIKNTKFKSMNFEFVTFDNISTENIKLPFPTIPYIYGGITYLINTDDKVKITSAKFSSGIEKKEYLNCLSYLEQYYKYTQNYFPLCNILIAKNQYDLALVCIAKGIEISIIIRKFRMLVYYCKLLSFIPTVNVHIRQELYMKLMENISIANLASFECENLALYLPQVTTILLEDTKSEKITVFIDTDIDGTDNNKIAILYSIIDNLLDDYCTYSIQLRHNSPITAFLQIFTEPENVNLIIMTINAVFMGIQARASIRNNKIQERIKSQQEIEEIKTIEENNAVMLEREKNAKNTLQENKIEINNCSIHFNGDVHIHKT